MKKKLIFLNITKFLGNYDYEKYELREYENFFNVEVHELIDVFYPGKSSEYRHLKNTKKIYNFKNLESWKHHIKKLQKKFKLIVWFQTLPINFGALKAYTFLKSNKIKVILTHHGSLPFNQAKKNFFEKFKSIPYKIKILANQPKEVISWYKKIFIMKYLNFFQYLAPDYIITNGEKKLKIYKKVFFQNTKIISINAWDFSRIYKTKKTKKIFKSKYICYLSDGGPKAPSDSNLIGQGRKWSIVEYYKELNFFFKTLEKKFNCKVIIAAHPRTSKKFEKKYLKSFKIYYGKTMELVKDSFFVVSSGSSANNYSIIFKKPILFLISNEHLKNPIDYPFKKLYADFIDVKIINISKKNEIFSVKKPLINIQKYNYFSKNFLKSIKKETTPNFKIIKKEILEIF